MSYSLIISSEAEQDILKLRKSGDKTVLNKLNKIFNELREHPHSGIGKPEQMKYDFSGCYSRRINAKHRLVYKIDETEVTVLIISAYGHYADK